MRIYQSVVIFNDKIFSRKLFWFWSFCVENGKYLRKNHCKSTIMIKMKQNTHKNIHTDKDITNKFIISSSSCQVRCFMRYLNDFFLHPPPTKEEKSKYKMRIHMIHFRFFLYCFHVDFLSQFENNHKMRANPSHKIWDQTKQLAIEIDKWNKCKQTDLSLFYQIHITTF